MSGNRQCYFWNASHIPRWKVLVLGIQEYPAKKINNYLPGGFW